MKPDAAKIERTGWLQATSHLIGICMYLTKQRYRSFALVLLHVIVVNNVSHVASEQFWQLDPHSVSFRQSFIVGICTISQIILTINQVLLWAIIDTRIIYNQDSFTGFSLGKQEDVFHVTAIPAFFSSCKNLGYSEADFTLCGKISCGHKENESWFLVRPTLQACTYKDDSVSYCKWQKSLVCSLFMWHMYT